MKKHLGWFYGRLAKASVPKASSSEWSEVLPKAVLAPDLPVPKRSKVRLRDVTINDGLHWHGLMVVNPLAPKMQTSLDLHINGNLRKYLVGSIRTIGVTPITHTPEYVTGYGLKSLKDRFSTDEIVIFPRSVSELPSDGPDPRKGPRAKIDDAFPADSPLDRERKTMMRLWAAKNRFTAPVVMYMGGAPNHSVAIWHGPCLSSGVSPQPARGNWPFSVAGPQLLPLGVGAYTWSLCPRPLKPNQCTERRPA